MQGNVDASSACQHVCIRVRALWRLARESDSNERERERESERERERERESERERERGREGEREREREGGREGERKLYLVFSSRAPCHQLSLHLHGFIFAQAQEHSPYI